MLHPTKGCRRLQDAAATSENKSFSSTGTEAPFSPMWYQWWYIVQEWEHLLYHTETHVPLRLLDQHISQDNGLHPTSWHPLHPPTPPTIFRPFPAFQYRPTIPTACLCHILRQTGSSTRREKNSQIQLRAALATIYIMKSCLQAAPAKFYLDPSLQLPYRRSQTYVWHFCGSIVLCTEVPYEVLIK